MVLSLRNYRLQVLMFAWALCFIPIYSDLIETWLNHSDNSHGMLVPFISLYLIYLKKDALTKVTTSPFYFGGVLLVICMLGYLISLIGAVSFTARVFFILSLICLLLFTLGTKLVRLILFPLIFLLFMVPVPDSIIALVSLPLQNLATTISAQIIKLISIPVLQEGNMLYFAQAQLEVAQACSGIRSIVSLTMLSLIFAYLSKLKITLKITLLISAIPIAMLANIIRVSGTGILAHMFGGDIAEGFLHDFSGLAVFAFGFLVLLSEYLLLKKVSSTK